MKVCSKCKLPKLLSDFNKLYDGLYPWCRECQADYRRNMPDEQREKYRLRQHVHHASRRSKRDGLPFSLTEKTIPVRPGKCPCCYRVMKYDSARDVCPTLDRIVPAEGYVPENLQWLCHRCNRLKSDASLEDLMQVVLHMAQMAPRGVLTVRGMTSRLGDDDCLREPREINGHWYAPIDWEKAFTKYG